MVFGFLDVGFFVWLVGFCFVLFLLLFISGGKVILKIFNGRFAFNMSNRPMSVWELFSGDLTTIFY